MLRKIIVTILAVTFTYISTLPINAETIENGNEFSDAFKNTVYNSESYNKYKDDIESIYVDRTVVTDEGIRCTIIFDIKTNNSIRQQLVFIGDDMCNILENSLVSYQNDNISVLNFRNNIRNTTYISDERGAAYLCFTKVCQTKQHKLKANPACSQILGLPCNAVPPVFVYGVNISKAVCKLGVFAYCNYFINYYCTSFVEEQDVCTF